MTQRSNTAWIHHLNGQRSLGLERPPEYDAISRRLRPSSDCRLHGLRDMKTEYKHEW